MLPGIRTQRQRQRLVWVELIVATHRQVATFSVHGEVFRERSEVFSFCGWAFREHGGMLRGHGKAFRHYGEALRDHSLSSHMLPFSNSINIVLTKMQKQEEKSCI